MRAALILFLICFPMLSLARGPSCADVFAPASKVKLERLGIHRRFLRTIGLGKGDLEFELANGPISRQQLELERENLAWFHDHHDARVISRLRPSQLLGRNLTRRYADPETSHGIVQVVQLAGPIDRMLIAESHIATAPREIGIFVFYDTAGKVIDRSELVTDDQLTRIGVPRVVQTFDEAWAKSQASGIKIARVEFIHSHPLYDIEVSGPNDFRRRLIAAVTPPDVRFFLETLKVPGEPIPLVMSAVVANGYVYSAVIFNGRIATRQFAPLLFELPR